MKTNADLKVSMRERSDDATLGKYTDFVEKKIRETPRSGVGYKPQNFDASSGERIVTREILGRDRGVEFAPVIPAGWEYDTDGRVVWALSPYDYHQVLEGRVCHACLEWQEEVWTPACSWRGKNGEGCGALRRIVGDRELHGNGVL